MKFPCIFGFAEVIVQLFFFVLLTNPIKQSKKLKFSLFWAEYTVQLLDDFFCLEERQGLIVVFIEPMLAMQYHEN